MGNEISKVNEDLNHLHHELNDNERSVENQEGIIKHLDNIYKKMESNEEEMVAQFNGKRRVSEISFFLKTYHLMLLKHFSANIKHFFSC